MGVLQKEKTFCTFFRESHRYFRKKSIRSFRLPEETQSNGLCFLWKGKYGVRLSLLAGDRCMFVGATAEEMTVDTGKNLIFYDAALPRIMWGNQLSFTCSITKALLGLVWWIEGECRDIPTNLHPESQMCSVQARETEFPCLRWRFSMCRGDVKDNARSSMLEGVLHEGCFWRLKATCSRNAGGSPCRWPHANGACKVFKFCHT